MKALHTENSALIIAPPERVFELAANIGAWPQLLSHYRYVRFHEGAAHDLTACRRLVSMSARRTGIPVRWQSLQNLIPERLEVVYHHVGGVTRGMDVVWRIEPEGPGCKVTILHDLPVPRWWMRSALVRYIVGHVFIEHVASKTLDGIKRLAESAASRGLGA